jgi:hypothetical protein
MRTLLSIFAITATVICVNFAAVPAFWIRLYGATPDSQAVFLYRLLAAVFGGIAVMTWRARSAKDDAARDATVRGALVLNALATIVAVSGALTGVYNAFAWGPVAMFGAFTLAFALHARETTARNGIAATSQ